MTNETNAMIYGGLLSVILLLMLILNQLAYEELTEYQNSGVRTRLQIVMEGNDVNESNR